MNKDKLYQWFYENLFLNPSCLAKSGRVAYGTGKKSPKGGKE